MRTKGRRLCPIADERAGGYSARNFMLRRLRAAFFFGDGMHPLALGTLATRAWHAYVCNWRDSDLPLGLPSGRYVMVSGPCGRRTQ
jgi:hypothetical protein